MADKSVTSTLRGLQATSFLVRMDQEFYPTCYVTQLCVHHPVYPYLLEIYASLSYLAAACPENSFITSHWLATPRGLRSPDTNMAVTNENLCLLYQTRNAGRGAQPAVVGGGSPPSHSPQTGAVKCMRKIAAAHDHYRTSSKMVPWGNCCAKGCSSCMPKLGGYNAPSRLWRSSSGSNSAGFYGAVTQGKSLGLLAA
ncbi:hypothetical protein BGX38DRAFT_1179783 [Terfezia claveryi]|nr:hypothetical protein BGX38DRAFT_1179783 [Terfezia claveryi]